ncbi:MAG: hypothetical protein ACFFCS_18495 [Candidatus Hodarchaeota archaeon]
MDKWDTRFRLNESRKVAFWDLPSVPLPTCPCGKNSCAGFTST